MTHERPMTGIDALIGFCLGVMGLAAAAIMAWAPFVDAPVTTLGARYSLFIIGVTCAVAVKIAVSCLCEAVKALRTMQASDETRGAPREGGAR